MLRSPVFPIILLKKQCITHILLKLPCFKVLYSLIFLTVNLYIISYCVIVQYLHIFTAIVISIWYISFETIFLPVLKEILIGISFHVHIYLLSGFAPKLKNLTARVMSFLSFLSFPFHYYCVLYLNIQNSALSKMLYYFINLVFSLFNMFSYFFKIIFIFDINKICFYRWLCDFLFFIVQLGTFCVLYLLLCVASLVLLFLLSDYSFIYIAVFNT